MDKFVIRGGNPLVGTVPSPARRTPLCPAWPLPSSPKARSRSKTFPRCATSPPSAGCWLRWARRSSLAEGEQKGQHHDLLPQALRPRRALRDRQDHARQLAGARPAHRPCRRGPRGHARRVRHRRPSHRPAHQGPGEDGRDHHRRSTATSKPAPTACAARTSSSTRSPSPAPKIC